MANTTTTTTATTAATTFEEVLQFWFGGEDQRINYKTKWFPSSATSTTTTTEESVQQQADQEIHQQFSSLLTKAMNHELDDWCQPTSDLKAHLALIVVLDQFARHIFRFQRLEAEHSQRKIADQLALECTEKLIQRPDWLRHYSSTELIFALMPYRHNPTIERLQFVCQSIDTKEEMETNHLELLNKFRKQTVTRLQRMTDRARADASDDVLERSELDVDDKDMINEKLVHTTKEFLLHQFKTQPLLEERPVFISLSGGVDSMVIARILVFLRRNKLVPISHIIAAHIDYANRAESGAEAAYVQQFCRKHDIQCEVRVINEVTRGITDRDQYEKIAREIRYTFYADILKRFANQSSLLPPQQQQPQQQQQSLYEAGMIFGHHLGDVQENVISNVMRGCPPLELSGMAVTGVVNGVVVWRPLLSHLKDEIFRFAHRFGVPYFKDTTPTWSTRGKLRQQLIPLLLDMYGSGCLHNLAALAAASDEMKVQVHQTMYRPFLDTVEYERCGLKVNVLLFKDHSLSFWRAMLKQLMHSMGMSLVREGGVQCLLDRLHPQQQQQQVKQQQVKQQQGETEASFVKYHNHANNNNKEKAESLLLSGWIELRKGFFSFLTSGGDLVIFRTNVFNNNNTRSQQEAKRQPSNNNDNNKESNNNKSKKNSKEKKEGRKRDKSNTDAAVVVVDDMIGDLETMFVDTQSNTTTTTTTTTTQTATATTLPTTATQTATATAETTKEVEKQEAPKPFTRVPITPMSTASTTTTTTSLKLQSWHITITTSTATATAITAAAESLGKHVLQSPVEVLGGEFEYSLLLPAKSGKHTTATSTTSAALVVYSEYKEQQQQQQQQLCADEKLQSVPALSQADMKIRLSLPLLVPVISTTTTTTTTTTAAVPWKDDVLVHLKYEFIPDI